MRTLTVGSLFSGIGGIDLGLERAGMRVLWHSEINPYASRVLAKHWPGVPNHGDITQIDFAAVEPVDVLAGGFPCQDVAYTGRRAGMGAGTRSSLWGDYARAVRDLRPRYVLVENVPGLLSLGVDTVLGDLSRLGYDAEWSIVPACAVGAAHTRERLFILGYPMSVGLHRGAAPQSEPVATGGRAGGVWDGTGEPGVRGVAYGIPRRVDRVAGLGNAVVPQIPELIGGWIIDHARATGYLEVAA